MVYFVTIVMDIYSINKFSGSEIVYLCMYVCTHAYAHATNQAMLEGYYWLCIQDSFLVVFGNQETI